MSITPATEAHAHAYLVERAVAAVEQDLDRHVGTVLDAADAGAAEIERDAKVALTRCRGERARDVVSAIGTEVIEASGIRIRGDENLN